MRAARVWITATLVLVLSQMSVFPFQPGRYTKWLTEDVAYILSAEEWAGWTKLANDEERQYFITQFWARRDPTPGTPRNEFKEEHYRRIAYANERFASGIPGWKTDRGRIYILYGPPNEVESHPVGSATVPYPFEKWRYHGRTGSGVIIEFVDQTKTGEYRIN